jgi:transcriptional regulator with XRE-family HTH domain
VDPPRSRAQANRFIVADHCKFGIYRTTTQEQVAQVVGTTQAAVARMESGKTLPSTRTLARFAKATRTRLRINFEPIKPGRLAAK